MRAIWFAALTFAAGIFAGPVPEQKLETDLDKRQYETQAAILDVLLAQIEIETSIINQTLAKYPDPLSGVKRKMVATHIGRNFERITFAINNANQILKTKTEEDMLRQEAEDGCGAHCVSQKMNQVIRQTGVATKNSILKLGFKEVSKYIQPAFLGLSGIVITLNGVVGGALVAVSALVNGVFLAIAAGIAYLGHLASEKEREQAGGPMGPKTLEISKLLDTVMNGIDR